MHKTHSSEQDLTISTSNLSCGLNVFVGPGDCQECQTSTLLQLLIVFVDPHRLYVPREFVWYLIGRSARRILSDEEERQSLRDGLADVNVERTKSFIRRGRQRPEND